jgi:hypothetical protein
MDKYTTLFGGARARAACLRATGILQQCPGRVEMMQAMPTLETWTQQYQHQFSVIVRGTGWRGKALLSDALRRLGGASRWLVLVSVP